MKQAVPLAKLLADLKNQSASAARTTARTAGGFTILKSFEYILETSTIIARQSSMETSASNQFVISVGTHRVRVDWSGVTRTALIEFTIEV